MTLFPYFVVLLAGSVCFFQYFCSDSYIADDNFGSRELTTDPVALDTLARVKDQKSEKDERLRSIEYGTLLKIGNVMEVAKEGEDVIHYTRETLYIPVPGDKYGSFLHAWLFLPTEKSEEESCVVEGKSCTKEGNDLVSVPIVVMAHGLGAQKDMGLERYAKTFVRAGYGVLVFDYRHFGGSITTVTTSSTSSQLLCKLRNFIYPWNHVQDYLTVIETITSGYFSNYHNGHSIINPQKISLWGTSFAGGHVLMATWQLPRGTITSIISQVPHLDGKAASKRAIQQKGIVRTIKIAIIAIADVLVSQVGGYSPLYIRICGPLEENAYMSLPPSELSLYYSKHPVVKLGDWKNMAPARTTAIISLYSPIQVVKSLDTPILFVSGSNDELCPSSKVREAQQLGKNAEMLEVDATHFEIYNHPSVLENMVNYLQKTNPVD
jgi:pimeloyl-ACP methyl ester carboxylesterase